MTTLEGLYALWYREIKVFLREKSRVVSSLFTPLLWIVVFGGGLGSSVSLGGTNYQVFIFPGILSMTVLFTSIFFGLYIVWDKRIDFFKEVLVAPLSRLTIFAGKMLGGCTDALIQGSLMLAFGVLLGVSYTVQSVVAAIVFMLVLASAVVSIGLVIGSRMESPEGFNLIVSFVVFPLFFLSGALFPIDNLPSWLHAFTVLNPVTYAVDGMRGAMLGTSAFPVIVDFVVLLAFAGAMIVIGSIAFSRMK
jgi:ABC-2 type transport system permease protein